jgi:hypothetical protein
MGVKLQSALGGSVELNAPSTASNFTMTVPAVNGTVATIDQLQPFKNKIINGACHIAQRGNVSIPNNAWTYGGCDRIAAGPVGFTTFSGTLQKVPVAFIDGGPAQVLGPVTTTGSGSIQFQQRIEAANTFDLNGKTITGSFWIYQTTGATITGNITIAKPSAYDNFGAQNNIASAAVTIPTDSWTQLSVTTTLNSTDASNGLVLTFNTAAGALTNRYFYITRMQLEQGSVATPFEHRPIGLELASCQRYYEKSYNQGTAPGTVIPSPFRTHIQASNQYASINGLFATPKRANPTVVSYNPVTGVSGQMVADATTITSVGIVTTESGLTIFCSNQTTTMNQFMSCHWTASSEL